MHGWEHLREEDRRTILEGIRTGRALGGPYHVEIDPVDRCNVDCVFCSTRHAGQMTGQSLEWECLSDRIDEMISGGLRSFRLAGGGEPLLYPKLGALVEKMASADCVLDNLTTNGAALNGATIDVLSSLRIGNVLVSLNYTTPDRYAAFMQAPPRIFDAAVANLRALHDALSRAERRDQTMLQTQFFLHRSTVEDVPRMIDLALDLPVDCVVLKTIGLLPENESMRAEDITRLRQLLQEHIFRLPPHYWIVLELDSLGLGDFTAQLARDLPIGWTTAPRQAMQQIEHCYIGWYSMTVQGNGDVHPCCFLMTDTGIPPFGNLARQTVGDIWRGEAYDRFRAEMRTSMLMPEGYPGQRRLAKCSRPECWSHDGCPMTYMLADTGFYQEAHEMLDAQRNQPHWRAAAWMNRKARRLLRR